MSNSGIPLGNNNVGDDCPLCLEPLPPFWNIEGRVTNMCCGKSMCVDCREKQVVYLRNAASNGSYGRQEHQLARTCPLCRDKLPDDDNAGKMMLDKFEKGQLPLTMYSSLGLHCLNGTEGVAMNTDKGIEIMMLGANKGDPECKYMIGGRYKKGVDGIPKSMAEAKRWLLAATEQGHAFAELSLALMLKDEGNDAEFLRHLSGSASKGYDVACYSLGRAYYSGSFGLQQSTKEAIRSVTPAAERGDAMSMGFLGTVLCQLQDDPNLPLPSPQDNPNFTTGAHWLRRAVEEGDQDAASSLRLVEEKASSMCFRCAKKAPPEKAFLRCSRCRAAWYCSKDCQVQHWKAEEVGHKPSCIKWK